MKKLLAALAVATALWGGFLVHANEVKDLSSTDASNTGTAANAGFPENMPPSDVNNAARALEGMIARWYTDWRGVLRDYGAANTVKVTPERTIGALFDGLTIAFKVTTTNTGAATLQLGSLTAKTIKKHHDQDLASGDLEAGSQAVVTYHADEDTFQLLTPTAIAPVTEVTFTNPMTTRGDIITRDANAPTRLALGAANTVLHSDGTDTEWKAGPIGKHTVWIPAGAMRPTASNGAASLADLETTSGRPDITTLDFDQSSDQFAQWSVQLPRSFDGGTLAFTAYWTAAVAVTSPQGTTWELQCVHVGNDDTIDVAYGTAIEISSAGIATAEDMVVTSESAPVTCAGTWQDADLSYFRIGRDVSEDVMTTDSKLLGVALRFTADTMNDN